MSDAQRRAELYAKRHLSIADVAFLVELSEKTVRRAIAERHLEASLLTSKRGGWRITHGAIEKWMEVRSTKRRRRRRRRPPTTGGAMPGRPGTLEP